ncbi:hypothetical protein ZIOFF_066602 [Zingiber officinale]|uniref:NAD-dependent epimerase/dehydratase domain-containing protein n=1 Tax=Zingiber officinale TaxID=94328 RepID=A0A8J5EYY5_ZINOF|nr:hypothetical protein ZIOFF_066602 [Zingiber officinale]
MDSAILPDCRAHLRPTPGAVPSPERWSRRHSPAPIAVAETSSGPRSIAEGGSKRLFVFGTGFVGRYVSDRLLRQGWHVSSTSSCAPKKRELEEMGLDAFIFDANKDKLTNLHTLQCATHLLVSIPPLVGIGDPLGIYVYNFMYMQLLYIHRDLQAILEDGNLEWLGYLSSTSVYGDCGGLLVDEDYPPNPKTESAKLRLAAETGWQDLGYELGVSVNVFRLGGIYGPGRCALDTILKGNSLSESQIKRASKVFTSRIHVADVYQALKASFGISSSRMYNVVDDDPTPRQEVFAFARSLIEKRWPGLLNDSGSIDTQETEAHKVHVGGEKRVSNARLKKELGVNLLYPTYRLGLQAILESCEAFPGSPERSPRS